MSQSMYMFDDINVSLMPAGAYAYAGYVDGLWPTYSTLQKTFPSAHLLSITVFGNDAEAADVESGDMTNAQVYSWFVRQLSRSVYRPCVYTSASNAYAMQATMKANGFARSSYRLWTAHYTSVPHFCAPNTCGYGMDQADATQFTSSALGRSLDESIVADNFFAPAAGIAANPVSGLRVTRRGWTSVTLAWDADANATSYTVSADWAGGLSSCVVTSPGARIGHLPQMRNCTFSVRAHPGGSTGKDATITVRTR